MLRAIAIYFDRRYTHNCFQKFASAPTQGSTLFAAKLLDHVEKTSLPSLPRPLETSRIYEKEIYRTDEDLVAKEFHYFLHSPSKGELPVYAIVSKKSIDKRELYFLFKNIEHIYLRPETVNKTLEDILKNPLAFTGKDILIDKTNEELRNLKQVALNDIDLILERGEKMENLIPKVVVLNERAKKFEDKAKSLNSCCTIL